MQKNNWKQRAWIALFLGGVYPLVFSLLTSLFLPGRDESPPRDNPLGVVLFCGVSIFYFPIGATVAVLLALINAIQVHQYVIPLFDSLSNRTQINTLTTFGFIVNVLVWLAIVMAFQRFKKNRGSSPGYPDTTGIQKIR
jgi:ABC-type Fe3+-siderophore transport system permease subunit